MGTHPWQGDTLLDQQGQIILGLSQDITERQEYRERLAYAASHDALTGLPNRSALLERLEQALLVAERNRGHVAVLFFDLDGFKLVNDTYGHEVGDQLLKNAAQHWRAALRQSDFLARQSGDEFVVVLTDFLGAEQIEAVAQKLIDVLKKDELAIAGGSLRVEVSVGIAVSSPTGGNPKELLQQADTAMYAAKKNGGDQYRFFDQGMALRSQSRVQTMSGLRQALADKGLMVAYQPIYQTSGGKLLGMEALMRWEHPSQGLLGASSFLPQVSQPSLLVELNQWVMHSAMRQFVAWRRQGLPTGWLSLNIPPAQLRQAMFREMLIGLLEQHDLEPSQLVLEITEDTFFSAEAADLEAMRQLVGLGVRFAIDDFGTGYSNLSYLQQLPVQIIKIDHAFTQKLSSEQGRAIIRGLISIAHNLSLQTICEGIETEEQLAFVRAEGCDMVQGYGLSRPLLEEGMLELLRLPNK